MQILKMITTLERLIRNNDDITGNSEIKSGDPLGPYLSTDIIINDLSVDLIECEEKRKAITINQLMSMLIGISIYKRLTNESPYEVRVNIHEEGEPLFICASSKYPNIIWLETENDANVKEEINTRFKTAIELELDELDFYSDMIETGITPELVKKYGYEEQAKYMEEFCKNHGLL